MAERSIVFSHDTRIRKGELTLKQRVKRGIAFVIAAVLTISMMAMEAFAVDNNQVKQTDVYLVLDNSKSMKNTDPELLLSNAAQQFFNTTPLGSNAGVIMYCGEVQSASELQEKKKASDRLNEFVYDQQGSGTNIGEALTEARNRLIENGKNPNKAIVLITDGADNGGVQYNIAANGEVIPVYCVYINDGTNKEDSYARTYLSTVAHDSGTDDYIEIKNAQDIEVRMDEICRKIYGTTISDGETVAIAQNEQKDVPVEIGERVYTASGTILHTDEVKLKIVDPNGTVIYDAADPNLSKGNDMLSVEPGKNMTSINMLWPDAGTYTFTVSSEIDQDISLEMITISSGIDLNLDTTEVKRDGKVIASCKTKDGDSIIESANLRVHDANGNVIADDMPMTDDGNGTFTAELNMEQLNAADDKTYSVVAVAKTNDGQVLASNKQTLSVTDHAAANTDDTKGTGTAPAKKSGFPIWIIPVAIIVLAAIVIVVKKVTADKDKMIHIPLRKPISVKIYDQTGLLIDVSLQSVDVKDGKETNLYDAIKKAVGRIKQPIDNIPDELKKYTIQCTAHKNDTINRTITIINTEPDGSIQKRSEYRMNNENRQLFISLADRLQVKFELK